MINQPETSLLRSKRASAGDPALQASVVQRLRGHLDATPGHPSQHRSRSWRTGIHSTTLGENPGRQAARRRCRWSSPALHKRLCCAKLRLLIDRSNDTPTPSIPYVPVARHLPGRRCAEPGARHECS